MLPLQQALEVKHSILAYLKATFSFQDAALGAAFDSFIHNPEQGMFKGPYVSVKLPFRPAPADAPVPLTIKPTFPPYQHQYDAFKRLTTADGHQPQPTLITTGTGSGKTECFLYPVLDYCYQQRARRGVKVIILYPMNALATDQAKRLAEAIWSDDRLRGKVTAGLFIGESKQAAALRHSMGEDHVIEERQAIVDSPPDILLTNFKMLDYALLRAKYHHLWHYNLADPSLLRFLVLDELHTYDGAQGTDVANLLRRLQLKLLVPVGQLCPVGTSATLGSGAEAKVRLAEYAQKIFGEPFDAVDGIIEESRVAVADFFLDAQGQPADPADLDAFVPPLATIAASLMGQEAEYNDYLRRQRELWLLTAVTEPLALGQRLRTLRLVHDLLAAMQPGPGVQLAVALPTLPELTARLADLNPAFGALPEWHQATPGGPEFNPREEVLSALLALLAAARSGPGGRWPLVYVQAQLWVRELSGLLREIGPMPRFVWRSRVGELNAAQALPPWFCRECGASGWLAVKHENRQRFEADPLDVYKHFFERHKNAWLVNTLPDHAPIEEYVHTDRLDNWLDPVTLALHEQPGPSGSNRLEIVAVHTLSDRNKLTQICPECDSRHTLSMVGSRVPTLSSIAVSQTLASDLDPAADPLRKVLAFTNSVQDAAHQAGFVEARNYNFTLRSSLQRVINEQGGTPISIPDLQAAFWAYWKTHASPAGAPPDPEAYYYRFFPKDYTNKADLDNDYRGPDKKLTAAFKTEFDLRLGWDIASEFGYNARVGRTLEKSGASAVIFDEERLRSVFGHLQPWLLTNELTQVEEAAFVPFLSGLLHRIRIRGGVDHPHLRKFRAERQDQFSGLNWQRDARHFLNKMYGSQTRLPRLVTTALYPGNLLDTTHGRGRNWFSRYFERAFPSASAHLPIVHDFYTELFNVLEHAGLVDVRTVGGVRNYCLVPAALLVLNQVTELHCDKCASTLWVGSADTVSMGAGCLSYRCEGHYVLPAPAQPNYYQLVYNRQRAPRIYASEHTGLLPRPTREKVEISFKQRPRPNSLNALVATSTLEMGIDIGTLDSAINNAVPPLPANFLQRVGRAGRASGTALVTTFAQGSKPHDLFYFAEPREMMQGDVATPGCYLEARDILVRHYLAYCFDSWASADPAQHVVPSRMGKLKMATVNLSAPDFLPNRLIAFMKANAASLFSRFHARYAPDISNPNVFTELQAQLTDDALYGNLRRVFQRQQREYQDVRQRRQDIDKIIKERSLAVGDPERDKLEADKKALAGLRKRFDQRQILEYLTNAGLLPNYAFPETGVTLDAWVRMARVKGSDGLPGAPIPYEIVRPASVALRELAPDNFFYAQGHKFKISGLNTFDWTDPATLLNKRFCSNCDHLADVLPSAVPDPHCPKCQDPSWASSRNLHTFVRLNGVKSANSREDAALDDSSDDRDNVRYRTSRHLHFHPDSFQGAWGMKTIPFGIEYVKQVDITDVNLGGAEVNDANRIEINTLEEVPNHGFVTCRHCGKSTTDPQQVRREALLRGTRVQFHYGYCRHLDRDYAGHADEVFAEVFLFRTVRTEALKILLPVQEFEAEATIAMFEAGLQTGLRRYYQGSPAHIGFIHYREHNPATGRFDRYLVLHDQIPGGTGYLEKLFQPSEFTQLLTLAYAAIRECDCQYHGKDGCYRCVYSYLNQRSHPELSRRRAEELFGRIVASANSWEPFTTGLSGVSGTGQIEESELEERFIRSLRKAFQHRASDGWQMEDFVENGALHHRLRLTSGEYVFDYIIRKQVPLGPAEGVKLNTRPDFYISASAVQKDGYPVAEPSVVESIRHMAVYLDGYTYHATAQHMRFFTDVERRAAINAAPDKTTWTLSWADLDKFDADEDKPVRQDTLWLDQSKFKSTFGQYQKFPYWGTYRSELLDTKNSMERLLWVLAHPLAAQHPRQKISLLLSQFQPKFGIPSYGAAELKGALQFIEELDPNARAQSIPFYVVPALHQPNDLYETRTLIGVKDLDLHSASRLKPTDADLDKPAWEAFWQLYNLVQTQHKVVPYNSSEAPEGEDVGTSGPDTAEIIACFDDELHPLVQQLLTHGVPFGQEGSFFLMQNGKFTAEAALGFEAARIFINPLSPADKQAFEAAGYHEVAPADFTLDMVTL